MHHSSMNTQRVTRTHGGATWTCGLRYKLAFQQARKQMQAQSQMQGHTYTHMKPHVLTWPRMYLHFLLQIQFDNLSNKASAAIMSH